MTKANIYIYTHPSADEIGIDSIERHPVDNFKIDGNVVVADECGDKWIYPLTSTMGIEVLNDDNK